VRSSLDHGSRGRGGARGRRRAIAAVGILWLLAGGAGADTLAEAEALARGDRLEEAARAYTRALDASPALREALLGRARVYGWLGERELALADLERVLAASPDDAEARVARARILGWMGRRAEAEGELERVLAARPDDVEARLVLGDVLAWQQRLEEAARSYEAARAAAPGDPRPWLALARIRIWQGDRRRAREAYEQALRIAPGDEEAVAGLRRLESVPRERRARLDAGLRYDVLEGADWRHSWTRLGVRILPRLGLFAGFDHFDRFDESDSQATLGAELALPTRGSLSASVGLGPDADAVARRVYEAELAPPLARGCLALLRYRDSEFAGSVRSDLVSPAIEVEVGRHARVQLRYSHAFVSGGARGRSGSAQLALFPEARLALRLGAAYGTEGFADVRSPDLPDEGRAGIARHAPLGARVHAERPARHDALVAGAAGLRGRARLQRGSRRRRIGGVAPPPAPAAARGRGRERRLDGRTLRRLIATFGLRPVSRSYESALACRPIRATYESPRFPNLVVVDKENGGKGDALNAGINVARYPLFCAIDGDSVLEEDALLRIVRPFYEQPDRLVAGGGTIRIVNGCAVRAGRIVETHLPRGLLARLQVLEYLRAFLFGRMGWSALNGLLLISGAFGIFRKQVVVEAGGYASDCIGEDLEILLRVHRTLRDRGRRYRVSFVPEPVCWTEAPERLEILGNQRDRWQRRLLDSLWRHRGMIGRPRYGVVGLFALPFYVLFELLGPVVEALGYVLVALGACLGVLQPKFLLALAAAALLYTAVVSIAALLLDDFAFRRHSSVRELLLLTSMMVSHLLREKGHEVLAARDGAEALALAARERPASRPRARLPPGRLLPLAERSARHPAAARGEAHAGRPLGDRRGPRRVGAGAVFTSRVAVASGPRRAGGMEEDAWRRHAGRARGARVRAAAPRARPARGRPGASRGRDRVGARAGGARGVPRGAGSLRGRARRSALLRALRLRRGGALRAALPGRGPRRRVPGPRARARRARARRARPRGPLRPALRGARRIVTRCTPV
jgi:tetratricopeptide (TPR) repeat protein/glycosyltransferase involved in cell wall biosynthesis